MDNKKYQIAGGNFTMRKITIKDSMTAIDKYQEAVSDIDKAVELCKDLLIKSGNKEVTDIDFYEEVTPEQLWEVVDDFLGKSAPKLKPLIPQLLELGLRMTERKTN